MDASSVESWWWWLLAAAALSGLVWRYVALARAGNPLPAGTGGTRLRGVDAEVVVASAGSDTAVTTGPPRVRALGDVWHVAQDLDPPLDVGEVVRVVDVEGTRLVVARVLSGTSADDAPRSSPTPDEGAP